MPYEGQARVGDGPLSPARIDLTEDVLSVSIGDDAATTLPLVDIEDVSDQDYVLTLTDHQGRRVELTMLGHAYGQVVADLRKHRDAALERDLLLRGVGLRDSFPGKIFGGTEPEPVEVRLYEDLMVVVPERGRMFGVPYSFVDRVDWDEELYQVHVLTDDGRDLVFGHLGKRTEEFRNELGRLLDALAKRTAATLQGLIPGLDAAKLGALAGLMRDGRAAQRWQIDEIDPSIWPRLEAAAAGTDELRAAYESLSAMTVHPWAAFGVKAVLTEQQAEGSDGSTSEAPTDLWYFCPLQQDGKPLNVVAQEVASGSGHATYLFRILPTERFGVLQGDQLGEEVGRSIHRLNRALLQLNFRREPIYLSDEEIASGDFARYRVALRKLDYLRLAREAFLGRAVHNAGWEKQVLEAARRA